MFHGNVSPEIASGLLKLKERIEAAKIPPSKLDETINIATWNVREFGKKKRSEAAIHYIAEIINQFDIVGLVELRDNLNDLGRVLKLLGTDWKVVYSDMIPDAGGNRERLAFIYDERAAKFNGLAAEVNPPRQKKGLEYISEKSFWRSPYMASFKTGQFDFIILTTHIRWGDDDQGRVDELERLAAWIEGKRIESTKEDKDLIVMGDFNIPSTNDEMFKAITKYGLQVPKALQKISFGSNLEKNKRYDQILHHPIYPDNFTNAGGVLDFYIDEQHIGELFPGMNKLDFTYQMSDHLPLWMQVNVDIDGFILEEIVQN